MRRKSERNKSKSSEKKVDSSARKSRRTSRRRKRSTSHSSSDGSDDAPLVKAVAVETPQAEITADEPKKSTSNSDEEKQEQPIWKVKTSESPSGEIQKLKICLQRPSTTPERTEKSPRRRRAKASSQSDDAYLTPDEKPQQQHQSRRKLRRGSPPLNKDDAEMKVINDEASEGKGKLECSQRRQDTETEKCVQDSQVNKSLGPSELSNNVPQEEDIKSTTSTDDKATPECKDIELDTSQDSAIEPIKTLNSEHLETEILQSSPKGDSKYDDIESSPNGGSSPKTDSKKDQVISSSKEDSKRVQLDSSPKTESKIDQLVSAPITESKKDQVVSSPKRDSKKEELESASITDSKKDQLVSSPKRDSKKDQLVSAPITESKIDQIVSSPQRDSKNDQLESSPKTESKKDQLESSPKPEFKKDELESSADSKECKVDAKSMEASPTTSEPSQSKLETSEQTTSVESTEILSKTEKLTEESSPTKDLQTSESYKAKKRRDSEGSSAESFRKTDEIDVATTTVSKDSLIELEVSDEVVGIGKKDKCEVSDIENAPAKIDNDDVEKKDDNNKTSKQDSVEEHKDSDKVHTIMVEESIEMIVDSEMINKEDLAKISETIKRDLNRTDTLNDDSDKSEPEEKIVISEDEETKMEISTTPTPETQQIVRPLHRRKWGKYSAKLQPDIRLTFDALTAVYPGMKLVTEEDLKLEIEEHREILRPVRKEREIVVLPQISPKEEDVEKEVSNIGLNRKISIVNDEASKLQPPPSPPKHPVSSILYLTNLVRPFTLKQLKELLSRTGKILDDGFWTDRIKSRCYVQYETEDEAEATRNALHGVQWPIGNGKKLVIDFGLPEAMEAARTAVETSAPAVKTVPEKVIEKVPELNKEQHQVKEDDRWDRKRAGAPTREWDLGKVPQDHRERSRSRDRARSRSVRSSDKRRHPRPESPSNGDHLSPRKKKKEEQTEVKLMDDLFRKTKAAPSIYWLPLTPDQIAKKQQQRLQRMAEHKRRMEESTRRVPSRDFGRGAPRSRRRYNAD